MERYYLETLGQDILPLHTLPSDISYYYQNTKHYAEYLLCHWARNLNFREKPHASDRVQTFNRNIRKYKKMKIIFNHFHYVLFRLKINKIKQKDERESYWKVLCCVFNMLKLATFSVPCHWLMNSYSGNYTPSPQAEKFNFHFIIIRVKKTTD